MGVSQRRPGTLNSVCPQRASNCGWTKAALLSLAVETIVIRLRGLNFVERDGQPDPEVELFRIDTCSAIAAGLGAVDLIRAADFQGRHCCSPCGR